MEWVTLALLGFDVVAISPGLEAESPCQAPLFRDPFPCVQVDGGGASEGMHMEGLAHGWISTFRTGL